MIDPKTAGDLFAGFDRTAAQPIGEQIHSCLRRAILDGVLRPGGRLPSGRDLAAQLGVARGTIRAVYDRLIDENLIFTAGAAGTRIRSDLPVPRSQAEAPLHRPLPPFAPSYSGKPLPFRMGMPAHDAFPAKLWSRLRTSAVRADALGFSAYGDPRGEPGLRAVIASHLAVSRQMQCHADQIVVTGGYRQGLALVLMALRAHGRVAWVEEPGYPVARRALELAGLVVEPISVDRQGICVEEGLARAPDAVLALVTPGQQAPLGMPLSPARRRALLGWAEAKDAWIVEDDYLGELQIDGRAAPALASGAGAGRVIHVGSFGKTMSPAVGLGFVVAPRALAERIAEIAAVMAPSPNRTTQLAVAEFLGDGHYLRHLRRMKALYAQRRRMVLEHLRGTAVDTTPSGLALVARLPDAVDDVALADAAVERGIAPFPLSLWYARQGSGHRGLLLNIANLRADNARAACDALADLLDSTKFAVHGQEPASRRDRGSGDPTPFPA